jgi:hypothetical protein
VLIGGGDEPFRNKGRMGLTAKQLWRKRGFECSSIGPNENTTVVRPEELQGCKPDFETEICARLVAAS